MDYLKKLQERMGNSQQDSDIESEVDQVNEDATSPYIEKNEELDPEKEYASTIKTLKERINRPEEALTWKDRLPDMLAAAHNILNYSKGNTLPTLEMGYADKIQKNKKNKKKDDISELEKLQKMHQQYRNMQRSNDQDELGREKFDWQKERAEDQDMFQRDKFDSGEDQRQLQNQLLQSKLDQMGQMTPYQKAQLELANKMTPYQQEQLNLAKSKMESEGKLSEYQKAQLGIKEKELELKQKGKELKEGKKTFEEKEKIKEDVSLRKGNLKTRQQAEKTISDLDTRLEKVRRAKKLMGELVKNSTISDTGPIDQYTSTFTSKGQKLRQAFNDLSLEKMSQLFQGMSKAVDSDAERKMFEQSQASMGNYPDVNMDVLNQMEKGILSLQGKNKSLMNRYNEKGEEIQQEMTDSLEVRRKTKDGRTAIFDAKTKEFIRYE